jgi:hypothetical protein
MKHQDVKDFITSNYIGIVSKLTKYIENYKDQQYSQFKEILEYIEQKFGKN